MKRKKKEGRTGRGGRRKKEWNSPREEGKEAEETAGGKMGERKRRLGKSQPEGKMEGKMNKTDAQLHEETHKWLGRLQAELPDVTIKKGDKKAAAILKNLKAYISDTSYFLKKKDYLRAFEACVYAWGILETGRMAGVFLNRANP